MLDLFKLPLQYILSKLQLTRLTGWGTSKQTGWPTRLITNLLVKYCKVNMKEAQKPDITNYRTFNELSVHSLRSEVRPIGTDPNVLAMSADGVINQLSKIKEDKILQAKDRDYGLEALLTGNYLVADLFHNGTFVTTYLSPRDHHRVHMPCNGILHEMIYVPDDLFSANRLTTQNVSSLFACGERMICLFDTEFGLMAQVLVGVTIVGSIETAWVDIIMSLRGDTIKRWTWPAGENDGSAALLKGQEMGRSKFGSTTINLFALGKMDLVEQLEGLSITEIGQPLAVSIKTFVMPDAEPAPLPAEGIEAEHDASLLVGGKKDQI